MKEKETPTTYLDTIDSYHRLYGLETLHPLASVVDFGRVKEGPTHIRLNYGFYALWLKHGEQCSLHYGRNRYDYQEGTVVSFAPGQVVEVEIKDTSVEQDSIGLLFHPDLIHGTSLGRHIGDYHFFDYDSAEALHLSLREQQMFTDTLQSICMELEMPIDKHSQTILVDRIKLLLDYCQRFYDRQFITRHNVNNDLLSAFEKHLREYLLDGEAMNKGLPTVAYFADKACLSAGYFGDLIKKETGMMARQLIQQRIVDVSKQLVLDNRYSINQISDRLGFQYPQHFTRFFKRHVGISPSEYRAT